MKKYISSIITTALIFTGLLFSSCQEVIFDSILDEVKLEEAQISGDVTSMTRFSNGGKEYIFATNGKIWKKDVTSATTGAGTGAEGPFNGEWNESAKPKGKVILLAADNTYLYALCVTEEDDEDEGENIPKYRSIFCSADGETWSEISLDDGTSLKDIKIKSYSENFALFCTNTPKNRAAFLNINSKYYRLNGTSATSIALDDSDPAYVYVETSTASADKNRTGACAVAFMDGKFYFTYRNAMTSNETFADEATVIYCTLSAKIGYLKSGESSFTEIDPSVAKIKSLAFTADSLLAGTTEGIKKINFSDNDSCIPETKTTAFKSNAESTLSSYYEIYNLIAVDPALPEAAGDLYGTTTFISSSSSTSANAANEGLWAYYPGRGKWNRE